MIIFTIKTQTQKLLTVKNTKEQQAHQRGYSTLTGAFIMFKEGVKMAYDIGPKIGIEGEAEFRRSISQINTNLRTLDTEMKAVASQYDTNDKSTEALSAKNEVLTKQIVEQKKKLDELKKGLSAANEKYGESDKVTQGWQQAVNKATADLNDMERELGQNNKELNNFGDEVKDATEKTNKFDGALGKVIGGLGKVGGAVGKAAVAGIAAVGTAAVGAAAGAFKLAKDVGETADELLTLSAQTGISAQQLQEWDYAMRFIDVDMDVMTKSMAKLIKSMDNASKGSKDSVDAFTRLGVSWQDSAGNLRNNQDVFFDLIDALGQVESETERDALSMRLFGKSAQELNPLISAGADELARLSEEAHQMGVVMSDEALEAAGEFDDAMQKLEASTKGLANTIGVAAIPAVKDLVDSVTEVIPELTKSIKNGDWSGAASAVSTGLTGILQKLTSLLPGLAVMAASIIGTLAQSLVQSIPQVLPPLISAALELRNVLIKTLGENGPMLIMAGLDALMMIINGIVDSLPELIPVAIDLIMALANGIVDNLEELLNAAVEIILALVDGLLDLLPDIIPVAIQAIVTLAKGLIDALPKLVAKVPEIVKTIIKVITDNLPLLIDAAIDIIMELGKALIDNLPLLIDASIEIMVAIMQGMIDNIGTLIAAVPKLFSALVEAFAELDLLSIGKDIIAGIVEGVKSAAKSLVDSVVGAAKDALKGVKDFLGIKSPSKVMQEQVGKMMGLGMAEGISGASRQMESAINKMNGKMQGIGNTTTGSRGSIGGGSNATYVNVPLSIDGKLITSATSLIQYTFNQATSRALGVVPE